MRNYLTPRHISMTLISLTLALAPFFSGLFEDIHRYFFMALLLGLCSLTLAFVIKGPLHIPKLGYYALALAGLYIIRIFFRPASYLAAVNAALIMLTAVMLYLTWANLKPSASERNILTSAVILSSFSLATYGLSQHITASASGVTLGRLETGFGYANATASWLVIGFLLSFFLAQSTPKRLASVITTAPIPIIGAALALTGSRGGWLTLAFVLALGLFFFPHRLKYVGQTLLFLVASIAFSVAIVINPLWVVLAFMLCGALFISFVISLMRESHVIVGLSVIAISTIIVGVYIANRLNTSTYTLANHTQSPYYRLITFEANGLAPDTMYTFKAKITVHNPNEAPSAATLAIWSRRGVTNIERLLSQTLTIDQDLSIELTLPTEADGLQVILYNSQPNTAVSISSLTLVSDTSEHELRNLFHQVLPYPLANNVARLAATDISSDGRTMFIADALKAFRQAPLFGFGGGAWQAIYPKFQAYNYSSTRAHSDPVEILLDLGIIGFSFYALFIGSSFIILYKERKAPYIVSCALVFLAFIVHGVAEALLGFPVICFASLSVLGLVQHEISAKPIRKVLVLLVLIFTCLSLSFGFAEYMVKTKGSSALALASTLNPLQVKYKTTIAQAEQDKAVELLKSASNLDPYNPVVVSHLGHYYLSKRSYVPAVEAFLKALDLQPMNITNYENAAYALAEAANALYPVSKEEAAAYANQVLQVYSRLLEKQETIPQRYANSLRITPRLSVDVGRAYAVIGENNKAWAFLSAVTANQDGSLTKSALPWINRLWSFYDASGGRTLALDFSTWSLAGGAYIADNDELVLPVYGATATSPLIYIGRDSNWAFSAEHYSDELRKESDAAGRLWGSTYYDSNLAKTPNTANYASNGNAKNYPAGEWVLHTWSYLGGNEVEYIRITIASNPTWSSPSYRTRNPVLSTR